MKWVLRGLAWLVLGALVALAPTLKAQLPSSSEGIAAQTYEGWSGVLRVWVPESYSPGGASMIPWLNKCFARFERAHPGVYVQAQPMSERFITQFADGELNPPDLLMFAPGMLRDTTHLLAIPGNENLLESLRNTGERRGATYALPIAMGGYAWAVNTQLLSSAPLGQLQIPQPKKGGPVYLMQAPKDSALVSWSGALLSLCLRTPDQEQPETTRPPVGEGIDLGLTLEEAPLDEAAPAPMPLELSFPQTRPKDFRQVASAMPEFVAGQAAAIPVTPKEIQRLMQRSDLGRGPEYQIISGLQAFTDQLLLCAVVDWPREDIPARQALCQELLNLVLDEKAQSALGIARALRVTAGAPLYTGQQPLAALERGYQRAIQCPNAFDAEFRARMSQLLDRKLLTE